MKKTNTVVEKETVWVDSKKIANFLLFLFSISNSVSLSGCIESIFINSGRVLFFPWNFSITVEYSKLSESCPLKTEGSIDMVGIRRNKGHGEATIFTLRELADATNNFSTECLLGRGGFGSVYKAFLNDRQVCIFYSSTQLLMHFESQAMPRAWNKLFQQHYFEYFVILIKETVPLVKIDGNA